jgi:hypothetical protein
MGNILAAAASDFSVEGYESVIETAHEHIYGSRLDIHNKEMKRLSSLSSSFFGKTKNFSNLNILFESSKSMRTLNSGSMNHLLKYEIQTNSLKILDTLGGGFFPHNCFVSPENENGIFVFGKFIRNSVYFFDCNVEEENGERFNHDKELNLQFSSIKYFDCGWATPVDFELDETVVQVNIVKENLFVCSLNACLVVDIHKNNTLKSIDLTNWNFNSDLKMTENYIYCEKIGFTMIEETQNKPTKYENFHSISKNEKFILYFDPYNIIGTVHLMDAKRFTPKVKDIRMMNTDRYPLKLETDSKISFTLYDRKPCMCFSEDSKFIFILTQDEENVKLIVFSIAENKFVYMKEMEDLKDVVYMDCMENMIFFSDCERMLQQVLEIRIPKLKIYKFLSPTDIQFKFK